MATSDKQTRVRGLSHGTIAAACAVFIAGMVGVSFAAVPLYRIFCQATGYQGTTRQATKAPDHAIARTMTIRFDANVANGLGWSFRPLQRSIEIKVGEPAKVAFEAENRTRHETTGTAAFNVAPDVAGAYFNKIACFCFTSQTLAAGQSTEMPVVFFVDPAIVNDRDLENIDTITLSYTFFPATPAKAPAKPVAAVAPTGGGSPL
jgi:cytochrome c oxidase assembly protein subunit 11